MKLSDALQWLEENEKTIKDDTNTCLISKLPIEEEIELPCGHKYNYNHLYEHLNFTQRSKKYTQCPYCRTIIKGYIPYYETECTKSVNKNIITRQFKNNMLQCSYVYQRGKNKGKKCGCSAHKFANGIYCVKHNDQLLSNKKSIHSPKQD